MKFTSILWFFVDFVNLVNYKIRMNDKNKLNNQENTGFLASNEDSKGNKQSTGIYLRDDHCDWGSSGMNEFTKEFGGDK